MIPVYTLEEAIMEVQGQFSIAVY